MKLGSLVEQAGLSRKCLAEKLNEPVDTVGKWIDGEEIPGVEQCFRLAEVLQVSLYDIYLSLISG